MELHTVYYKERADYAKTLRKQAEHAKNEKQKEALLAMADRAFSAQCNCGGGHDHAGNGYCGY